MDGVPPPIPVAPEVGSFEIAYRLPPLSGSTRQVAWARNIRHQYLSVAFAGIMEAVAGVEDPTPIYERLDALRGQQEAVEWIETNRLHLVDPVRKIMEQVNVI